MPQADLPGEETPSSNSNRYKGTSAGKAGKNHGRYGASDYSGCAKVYLAHPQLQAGQSCPECAAGGSAGKLYKIAPGTVIRLQGNPLISGTQYVLEKLRCSLCGKQYAAQLPADVAEQAKYDAGCRSNIALGRYYFGLPFKRMELWQRLQGVPLADATQWDRVTELQAMALPVYQCLTRLAPEGDLFFYDDTPNQILGLPEPCSARQGIYTTSVVSQLGTRWIYLYYTSHHYAKENVLPLVRERETAAPFLSMSDASSNNVPQGLEETLAARWIICFCLVHSRRKFWEICGLFEPECDFVLKQIGEVYQQERYCREHKLDAQQRLAHHQQHSAPVMEALRIWLNNKLLFYEVEPNSGLGQAISYMLRHWEALTRFLHVAGAPLDNSLCERAIKVVIRHRKNSLFFKTVVGAQTGDCLISIMHTAAMNQVNVFAYLNALQENAEAVAQEPALWLPWHYADRLVRQAA